MFLSSPPSKAIAQSAPCYDVRVEFYGRQPTAIIDNVQFYRWTYRVYGAGCTNRALSNWSLQICASTGVTGVSLNSVDGSDPLNGMVASYLWSFGQPKPEFPYRLLKWEFIGGNAINKANEYDEFSFIASGNITSANWSAKVSTITRTGTTMGPSCAPVATQTTTWGGIKSRLR